MSDTYTKSRVEDREYGQVSNAGEPLVLVVDTDPSVRRLLEQGLARSGYAVETASSVDRVLQLLQEGRVASVVMEILPGASLSLEEISIIKESPLAPQIVCTSIDSTPKMVVECMRRGAADFLVKPFSLSEARAAVDRVLDRGNGRPRPERASGGVEDTQATLLVGVSPAVHELRRVIHLVSGTDFNCLIRGESGVGKDVVAREIYRLSRRRQKPFVKVNCCALPEQLLESELFGYEKGAFTGAEKAKPGRFSLAHEGIIFLDEIGDMRPDVQAKILQVVEHKEFTKLGGGRAITVDVQIISASNANLEGRISTGSFREDLFYRLNEISITVPPLRDRMEDIPILVHHFLRKHGHYGSGAPPEVSGAELEKLSAYQWPGNVRELESAIKRWIAFGGRGPISWSTQMVSKEARTGRAPLRVEARGGPGRLESRVDRLALDPGELLRVLNANQWNRRSAAKELGVGYSTLRRRIVQYGLDKQSSR